MTVYLVRHAEAGDRRAWEGPDHLRPLTCEGRRQAERLAEMLAEAGIGRLVTSPHRRCRETLEPMARRLGIGLEEDPALAEGAPAEAALDLIRAAGAPSVLCSHGDVIGAVVTRLGELGALEGPPRWEKGSAWAIELGVGDIRRARYLPAP